VPPVVSCPLVSVVTPTWQRHDFLLDRCIPSVQAQDYPAVEHVIVSDGPDETLRTALGMYRDLAHPVRFHELPGHHADPNYGHYARVAGVELAAGEYITYNDDDDMLRPYHCRLMAAALDADPGAGFAISRMVQYQEDGRPLIFDGSLGPNKTGSPMNMHRRGTLAHGTWGPPGRLEDWGIVSKWLDAGVTWVSVDAVTSDTWPHGWHREVYRPCTISPETEPMIPLRLLPPGRRRDGVISCPVPSRNRTGKLAASVRSLRDTAAHPGLLEILVAHDPDDPATAEAARELGADVIWRAPERYGYARSAQYIAVLLERSAGEWVLPTWSDDAIMRTPGWDDLLRAQPAGSIAYLDGNYPGLTCFPAVHADALAAIGRLTPLPAIDTWFEEAGRAAGVLVKPGIYVHQDRPDITGCAPDQTHAEGGGAWRAGAGGTADQAYYREPYTAWRAEDAEALRRHRAAADA
jgi:hypothetical protein